MYLSPGLASTLGAGYPTRGFVFINHKACFLTASNSIEQTCLLVLPENEVAKNYAFYRVDVDCLAPTGKTVYGAVFIGI